MASRETPAHERRAEQPIVTREMMIRADTVNEEARTVDVVWSTGAPVRRRDWWSGTTFIETLNLDPAAVRLDRLNSGGAPVLPNHDAWDVDDQLGVVVAGSAKVDGAEATATLRFVSQGIDEDADRLFAKVKDGIINRVSVGYVVHVWNEVRQEGVLISREAADWEPYEISFVSIPADPQAGVRSEGRMFACTIRALPTQQEDDMSKTVDTPASEGKPDVRNEAGHDTDPVTGKKPETPEQRTAAFTRIRSAFGVSAEDQLTAMARSGLTADAWRDELIDARAAADEQSHTSSIRVVRDGRETMIAGMTDALVARLGRTAPTDQARSFMEHGFADMAAEAIGFRGRLTPARRDEVLTRAFHTTSDFPNVMGTAVGRVLLSRYQSAPASYREIFAKRDLVDFRATNLIRVGDFPNLLQVGEAGEVKAGTVSESKETITLSTYARQLRFSRSMLINDDLGAMAQIIASIGDRVAAFENSTAWALVQTASGVGPTLATDSLAVFHSTHGNLAGSGAVPGVSTISAGRAAMRKQKSLEKTADGTSGILLNISPKYIVSGPDHETTIEQLTTSIQAQDAAKVNPFSSKLTPIGEANITGNSWYLFADPNAAPVFTYGHLEGAPGPQVRQDEPFGVLGLALQVVLDFAVAAVDYRGAYRNPGAAPA